MTRLATVLVAVALVAVACALPTDESARELTGPDVEEAMAPPTTTTSAPGASRNRDLFFVEEGLLVPLARDVPRDASIADIINLLAIAPETEETTQVPEGFEVTSTELSGTGVLRLNLADDTLFELSGQPFQIAVAQIVVTATNLDGWDIEGVRFFLDGEPQPVPAGRDATNTDEPVDECDYVRFLPDENCLDIAPATTTSTTSTTVASDAIVG